MMLKILAIFAIWSLELVYGFNFKPPKDFVYDVGGGPVDGKINVFVSPHTHDDTGWIMTVDKYYFQRVKYILDTVVNCLVENDKRKFSYVEMGFFSRWWQEQTPERKKLVRKLVKERRLIFLNGGWCMHDEAGPMFNEMIDQTTRGHQFILSEFGADANPRTGWQIDPFGHSATQAWLLTSEVGFDAMLWGRMDRRDLQYRREHQRSEYIWQASKSNPNAKTLGVELWGKDGWGNYGCEFSYEGDQENIQDNPERHDYNLDKFVSKALELIHKQANDTIDNNILWTIGGDFTYQDAERWFTNYDKLIHYIKQEGSVNIFYSNPSEYVETKLKSKVDWEVRQDDLFPYRERDHEYWTGYFASRVALKRFIRYSWNTLAMARQVEALSSVLESFAEPNTPREPRVGVSWTDSLEGALSLSMHHDGVSGTEMQDVADDYALRISEALGETHRGIEKSLQRLIGKSDDLKLTFCERLNISFCEFTSNTDIGGFVVLSWNPLVRNHSNYLYSVPVNVENDQSKFAVYDYTGNQLESQLLPIDARTLSLPKLYLNMFGMTPDQINATYESLKNNASHVLVYQDTIPAIGIVSHKVIRQTGNQDVNNSRYSDNTSIKNEYYEISFNSQNKTNLTLKNLKSDLSTPFSIDIGYYESYSGEGQQSGAYLFRPQSSTFYRPNYVSTSVNVIEGPLVSEIQYNVDSKDYWTSHTIRLIKGCPFVEVDFIVGPLDGSKELSIRYSTNIQSQGVFYTDSNGREMMKRVRDKRPEGFTGSFTIDDEPIAGNYYPVNSMIAVEDSKSSMTLLTDATQGGSSIHDGQVELMVLRRLEKDDYRGVAEPLKETMCGCGGKSIATCKCASLTVKGKHRIIFDNPVQTNKRRRQLNSETQYSPSIMFAEAHDVSLFPPQSFLKEELPENVNLLTMSANVIPKFSGQVILRFEHMYSIDEHEELSKPVTFSFCKLFSNREIESAKETSLTLNHDIKDKRVFEWTKNLSFPHEQFDRTKCNVTLDPMQIRTFLVRFKSHKLSFDDELTQLS